MCSKLKYMKHLLRPCPICDNLSGNILHKQIFSLQKNSILPNEYDVVSCSKCGFVFADTSANQNKYSEYYLSFSKYEDKNSIAASGGGIVPNYLNINIIFLNEFATI